jgi:hypothetical protein
MCGRDSDSMSIHAFTFATALATSAVTGTRTSQQQARCMHAPTAQHTLCAVEVEPRRAEQDVRWQPLLGLPWHHASTHARAHHTHTTRTPHAHHTHTTRSKSELQTRCVRCATGWARTLFFRQLDKNCWNSSEKAPGGSAGSSVSTMVSHICGGVAQPRANATTSRSGAWQDTLPRHRSASSPRCTFLLPCTDTDPSHTRAPQGQRSTRPTES